MGIGDNAMNVIRLIFFAIEDVLLISIIVYLIKIDLLRKEHKKHEDSRRK